MQNIGVKIHKMSSNEPKQWSCAKPNLSVYYQCSDKYVANCLLCINFKYYLVSVLHAYKPLWPQKTESKFQRKHS